ncbi:hypothetical protein AQZ49_09945 [Novosphingobium sp. FSW06-99]|nr:hypothetical protein AQZ49_09945 [Novosphingobium sp. FSW06-99]
MIGGFGAIGVGRTGMGRMPVTQQASAAEAVSPPMITVVADAMRFMVASSLNGLDRAEVSVWLKTNIAQAVPNEEIRQFQWLTILSQSPKRNQFRLMQFNQN